MPRSTEGKRPSIFITNPLREGKGQLIQTLSLEGDLASKIIFIISPLDLVALSCDLLVDQPIRRKSRENVRR